MVRCSRQRAPRRKNRFPDGEALRVMELLVPSWETPVTEAQCAKSWLCCKVSPAKAAGQESRRPPAEGTQARAGTMGAVGLGFTSRPRKSRLPVCVSRMRNKNG